MGYWLDIYALIKPFIKDTTAFVQVVSVLIASSLICWARIKGMISSDQQEEMMADRKFKNILTGLCIIFLAGAFIGVLAKYFATQEVQNELACIVQMVENRM